MAARKSADVKEAIESSEKAAGGVIDNQHEGSENGRNGVAKASAQRPKASAIDNDPQRNGNGGINEKLSKERRKRFGESGSVA